MRAALRRRNSAPAASIDRTLSTRRICSTRRNTITRSWSLVSSRNIRQLRQTNVVVKTNGIGSLTLEGHFHFTLTHWSAFDFMGLRADRSD